MKLLYFGDFHERQKAPASRIDDWSATIHAKVKEIKAIAKDNNVLAMLQPGDFLDSPKVSDDFLYEILARWSDLDLNQLVLKVVSGEMKAEDLYKEIKKNKPMIGIVGNHELFGHSTKAFNKTTLSMLQQIGFMNLVTKESPILLKSEDGLTVAITGSNYHADIDRDKTNKDYIVDEKLGDFHIHLVHGYGTIQDFKDLMPHTKIQELGDTKADLTIIGHDHIGFDPIEINGKWFVNPGAPVRLSNDEKEMNRTPKVMLIEIEKDSHTLTMIPLKTAADSATVLDRTRIQAKADQQDKLDDIKQTIKDADLVKGENIVEIIENIADNKNISDELKADVRELVSKKAENLSVAKKSPQPYYIQKLVLENFQSHEFTEYEFSPGLNVFTGESRSGKTAIIRALGWIYEDYGGASRRFIKTGAKSASATIYLSNGFIITRTVDARNGGFNGYKVFYPTTGEWETMNTKALDVVQELLGFNRLQIDKTDTGKIDTIPLNFLRQGNSWFFIGDETSGSQRAKIIGTICGTNIADAAIREVEAKNKELSLLLRNAEKEIVSLDIEAGCMTHVEQMEKDIEKIDKLMDEMVELLQTKRMLEASKEAIDSIKAQSVAFKTIETELKEINAARKVIADMVELSQQMMTIHEFKEKLTSNALSSENLATIVHELKLVKEGQNVLLQMRELAESKTLVDKLSQESKNITNTGRLLKEFVKNIPNVESAKEVVFALRELHQSKSTILSYRDGIKENQQQQAGLSTMVESLKSVGGAKVTVHELISLAEQRKSMEELKKTVSTVDKDIATEANKLSEHTKEIKAVKLEYMDVFSHVSQCPLCLHNLTRDDAIAIAKNKFTQEG